MEKFYIDFSLSGIIEVDESEKEKVKKELSILIAKFIKDKNIINLSNNVEIINMEDILPYYISEVGEA